MADPRRPPLPPLDASLAQRIRPLTTFLMDLDGVLTDGFVQMLGTGEQVKRMNIKDGYALQHAVKSGYRVAVISGGTSEGAQLRLEKLGVQEVFMGVPDKLVVYDHYKQRHNLRDEEILYIGDDMPDYPLLTRVGLAACPADACADILHVAHYKCQHNGGAGCVREIMELVMKHHDRWYNDLTFQW